MLGFVPEWRVTKTHKDSQKEVPDVEEEALKEDVDMMEKGPYGLRIERLVDGREEQQTLAVRSISEYYT